MEPRRTGARCPRTSAIVRSDLHGDGRVRQRAIHGLEIGQVLADGGEMRVDGGPVAARDRPGQLEAVVDRAPHQRQQRFGRRPRRHERARRRPIQRDEVVRGHRRAGVIEHAPVVAEVERAADPAPWPATPPARDASASSPVTAAHAPSSCSGPRPRTNVCSGWTLKRVVCGASAASGVAPLMCAIHGPGAIDRATSAMAESGHAQQDELRVAIVEDVAALEQTGGDGGSEASAPDRREWCETLTAYLRVFRPGAG